MPNNMKKLINQIASSVEDASEITVEIVHDILIHALGHNVITGEQADEICDYFGVSWM
jgi:hypothetical protein